MKHNTYSALRQLSKKEYPNQLREIPDTPDILWIQGKWPKPNTAYLTVVGSRAATSYGKEAIQKLIQGLRDYPISIVSGLALGIDAIAHEAALAVGLHTIAIPGSGLAPSCIYPRTNVTLAHKIIESGGALLSEHPPQYRARPYDFPSRNRIMVGLADAVLIVEAAKRSGTLITARLANEYNRELLCVPHRIGDINGFGAQLFLRLGATLVTDSLHILESLRIEPKKKEDKLIIETDSFSINERIVYQLLETPYSRDELIRASKLKSSDAITALVSLELRGVTIEEFGMWQRR